MSSKATPISPPTREFKDDPVWIYVEYASNVYHVTWDGCTLNLDDFPHSEDYEVDLVELSHEICSTLLKSSLLDYGADSFIREDSSHPLPIIKISHPNRIARARLSYEFRILQRISELGIPVPRFANEPLLDSDGIYGYRMERLRKLDYANLEHYRSDVEQLLQRMHREGMAHGDLHPGNIMQNENGELVFIDLSCAGKSGDTVPTFIRPEAYEGDQFDIAADEQRHAIFFREDPCIHSTSTKSSQAFAS